MEGLSTGGRGGGDEPAGACDGKMIERRAVMGGKRGGWQQCQEVGPAFDFLLETSDVRV
jgi:hypothetical protein